MQKGNETARPTTLPIIDSSEVSSTPSIDSDWIAKQDRHKPRVAKGKIHEILMHFHLIVNIITFQKPLTSILRFPDKIISVKAVPGLIYELSGAVSGRNADINITKGAVLKFELDAKGHPFRIKTVKGTGQDNDVSSGISGSGVGQGQTSGVLIWDTSDIIEGTYYYQCEYHKSMVGRIIIAAKTGKTLLGIHLLYYPNIYISFICYHSMIFDYLCHTYRMHTEFGMPRRRDMQQWKVRGR